MVSTRSGTKSPKQSTPTAMTPQKRSNPEHPKNEKKAKKNATTPIVFFQKGANIGSSIQEDIELLDSESANVRISDLYKHQHAILFLYPRASTPGCTKQACGFRDHLSALESSGFSVFGLSKDSVSALKTWKIKHKLPFRLLSDPNNQIIQYFGRDFQQKLKRSHMIVLKGGVIADLQIQISPIQSVDRAIAFVKSYQKDAEKLHKLATQSGELVDIHSLSAEKTVILFLLSQSKETFVEIAKMYAKSVTECEEMNDCKVYGVSALSAEDLALWKEMNSAGFDILSDPENEAVKAFIHGKDKTIDFERDGGIVLKDKGKNLEVWNANSPQDVLLKAKEILKSETSH